MLLHANLIRRIVIFALVTAMSLLKSQEIFLSFFLKSGLFFLHVDNVSIPVPLSPLDSILYAVPSEPFTTRINILAFQNLAG